LILYGQKNGEGWLIAILIAQRAGRSVGPEQNSDRLLCAGKRREKKENED
jgi:hypothetical protein